MQPVFRRNIERTFLVTVALMMMIAVVVFFRFERHLANQRVFYYQLESLRTSVNLFKAITKRNPANLKELADADYRFEGEDQLRHYVEFQAVDKKGEIVDVFGNPYVYDSRTGWVRTSTPGYEYW
ncbi:MAG: hypothetical protein V2A66_06855 [Pseudomonadota bacterium]